MDLHIIFVYYTKGYAMVVFRFEDIEGTGPYTGHLRYDGEGELEAALWSHQDATHPSPYEEGLHPNGKHCGFKNRKQMTDWFTARERDLLFENGYRLLQYAVPSEHVAVGNKQVVFTRAEGKIISEVFL